MNTLARDGAAAELDRLRRRDRWAVRAPRRTPSLRKPARRWRPQ